MVMIDQSSIPNPYVGPRSFTTGERLYGRDAEVRDLLDLLIAERILLLHSPSGAGKSSLVQAGLIPALQQEGFFILPSVRVNLDLPAPYRDDCDCNRYIFSVLLSLEEGSDADAKIPLDQLVKMNLEQYLNYRLEKVEYPESTLLFFDQFEEILTTHPTDKPGKIQFFNQLGLTLRDRKLWALFAIREDYVAALDPFVRPLPTRLTNRFRLDFLGIPAARQAIQQPVMETGVNFTDKAVEKLVKDLRQVQVQQWDGSFIKQDGLYVEPVQLQVVCFHLWQQLAPEQKTITEKDIAAVGNVDQSLADYYSEEVSSVSSSLSIPEFRIRRWFEDKLITTEGIRGLVQQGKEESDGLDNQAIKWLENAHLVRSEKRLGSTWFELAHDRLIEPVRKNNAGWFQDNLNLLQRQARVWYTQGKPNSMLLHGQELADARQWADSNSNDMLPREVEYLQESLEEETRILEKQELERREQALKLEAAQQVAEAERKRAEEQARSAALLKRRNLFLWTALIAAIFLVLTTFYFFQTSRQNALALSTSVVLQESAARTAQAASTAAVEERNLAKTEEARAEAASILAERQRNTAIAAEAEALTQRNLALTAQAEAEEQRNVAIANEQARATAQANAETQLGARSEGLAELAQTYVNSQPDLSLLISVEAIRLQESLKARSNLLYVTQRGLDWNSRVYGPEFKRESYAFSELAFSPNGRYLAWGNLAGEVILYDLVSEEEVWRERNHSGYVYGLEFCEAGTDLFLASGSVDNWVRLYQTPNSEPVWSQQAPNLVNKLTFSPDCESLAVAAGSAVQIFGTQQGEKIQLLSDVQPISVVAWSPDGDWLATGLPTGVINLYETDTWKVSRLGRQGLEVTSMVWTPNSQILVSTGRDQKINFWEIPDGNNLSPIEKRQAGDKDVIAISKSGKLLALGGRDGKIYLWDMDTRQQIDQITFHNGPVQYIAFSEYQGKVLLVSGGFDHLVAVHEINLQQTLNTEVSNEIYPIASIALLADGSVRSIGINSGSVVINSGNLDNPIDAPITSVTISRDGLMLAAGAENGSLYFITKFASDLPEYSAAMRTGSISPIQSLVFSSDGQMAASTTCTQEVEQEGTQACTASEVVVWDVESERQKYAPFSHRGDAILSIAFSMDGRLLAGGTANGKVILWDLITNAKRQIDLSDMASSITSLDFSPDFKTLAAGSLDLRIILIDYLAGFPLTEPLNGSPAVVSSLAYDPSGEYLFSGHGNGSLLRWEVSSRLLIERACRAAERNMTVEEWQRLFPGLPYKETCP
jgi:WD40 repeat protein